MNKIAGTKLVKNVWFNTNGNLDLKMKLKDMEFTLFKFKKILVATKIRQN